MPKAAPSHLQKQKIVVVDDPFLREILTRILQKERLDVVEATNVEEGLDKVYENNPVLVLCDLMMPQMSGREFLSSMKSNPRTAKIPVVTLTAAASEENEVSILELGAKGFIRKGSSPSVILMRIRRALS